MWSELYMMYMCLHMILQESIYWQNSVGIVTAFAFMYHLIVTLQNLIWFHIAEHVYF